MTDYYDDHDDYFSFTPPPPTIAKTLDIVHLCNNDAKLISEIPPIFGNFRVKPVKALLFPIPTESTLLYDTKRFTYFEVVLRTKLEKLYVGFGFTARENHTVQDIVGWSEDSIGFHFDTGRVYQETSFTTRIIEKGHHLVDVVGDEVFGFMIDHEIGEFKVTRNGKLLENALGNRFTKERYKEKIFKPMVSLNCNDVEMEVNLGLDLHSLAIKVSKPNAGQRTLVTDSLTIEILGHNNVPKFTYSFANDSKTQGFKVQFSRVFQTDSYHKEVPSTNIALASLNYDFSEFVTNSDSSVDFNITSVGGSALFQFRIHVNQTSRAFKFDSVISGITWKNKAVYLALCYKVLDRDSGNEMNAGNSSSTRASFGKGFFDIEPLALANNGTRIKAGLRNSENAICVEYEKWEGTLVHDPTLGYSVDSVSLGNNVNAFPLIVLLVALIASILL